jgi:hypothetical protein
MSPSILNTSMKAERVTANRWKLPASVLWVPVAAPDPNAETY